MGWAEQPGTEAGAWSAYERSGFSKACGLFGLRVVSIWPWTAISKKFPFFQMREVF